MIAVLSASNAMAVISGVPPDRFAVLTSAPARSNSSTTSRCRSSTSRLSVELPTESEPLTSKTVCWIFTREKFSGVCCAQSCVNAGCWYARLQISDCATKSISRIVRPSSCAFGMSKRRRPSHDSCHGEIESDATMGTGDFSGSTANTTRDSDGRDVS